MSLSLPNWGLVMKREKRRRFVANPAIRNLDETYTHEREGKNKFFEPPPTM
jgi:hypothetical protein